MKKQTNTKTEAMKKTTDTKKTKSPPKVKSKEIKEKEELLKQLRDLIRKIDADGLRFLIKQANILVHNVKVKDKITEQQESKKKGNNKTKKATSDKSTIEIKESDDSDFFILIINKARNFFTLEEMRKIVKICHASEETKDASERLYNWLKNKRKDVLIDTEITGPSDPALETIYKHLIKTYTLKDNK